jgi:hypothetical protein
MPSVERPAVAIFLLDSFMPQPYRANITDIKPNVSPRVPAAAKVRLVLGGTKRSGIVAFLRGARPPFLARNPFLLSEWVALGVAGATAKRNDGTLEGPGNTFVERASCARSGYRNRSERAMPHVTVSRIRTGRDSSEGAFEHEKHLSLSN